jgi:hypothetical protein
LSPPARLIWPSRLLSLTGTPTNAFIR